MFKYLSLFLLCLISWNGCQIVRVCFGPSEILGSWCQHRTVIPGSVVTHRTVRSLASASGEGMALQGLTPARDLNYSLPPSSDKIQRWGGIGEDTRGWDTVVTGGLIGVSWII